MNASPLTELGELQKKEKILSENELTKIQAVC